MKPRIFLCAYGALGNLCLQTLLENHCSPIFLMTHKEGNETLIATAEEHEIPIHFEDMRSNISSWKSKIKNLNPDFLISINYRHILPKEIFSLPRFAFNIHGSLLPRYRGRTPHVWAIIHGETHTGITAHLIDERVDTGNIICQKKVEIESFDTGASLLKKFEHHYPPLMLQAIRHLQNGDVTIPQEESEAFYVGKRIPEMGYIDFHKQTRDVVNFIRAQAHPYPGAYFFLSDGTKVTVNLAIIDENQEYEPKHPIGQVFILDDVYHVRCLDGYIKCVDVHPNPEGVS